MRAATSLQSAHSASLCFLRNPHPTTPPLFPYTTPSDLLARHQHQRLQEVRVVVRRHALHHRRHALEPRARVDRRLRQDRKSTRLNSSHLGISYAVFCLKKKKKNTDQDNERKSSNTQITT